MLVVAKAPVPGLAKTRLAASIGFAAAADVAAAARAPFAARIVSMTGDLDAASHSAEIRTRLQDFIVIEQRGDDFADRLVNAHADAALAGGGLPVLQIGMDTPQVTAHLLEECARTLIGTDAVLGMARDGGWWILGVRAPEAAECLRAVPMSTAQTGAETLVALRDTGLNVELVTELADVDTVDDVEGVRRECLRDSRFRRVTSAVEV